MSDEQGEHEDESPLAHPIHAAEHEVEHLAEVADEGESPATPAILGGTLILILIPVVAILIGLSFLVAYLVTRNDSSGSTPWSLPNGDVLNTRVTHDTSISAANVSELGVAWTMPLTRAASTARSPRTRSPTRTASSTCRTCSRTSSPSTSRPGSVLWTRRYNSQDIGPNGVAVRGRQGVRGDGRSSRSRSTRRRARSCGGTRRSSRRRRRRAAASSRAASASTSSRRSRTGRVYLSTAALLGGGMAYALDAETGQDALVVRHRHRPGRREDHRRRRLEPAGDRPRRDRLPRHREHVPAGTRSALDNPGRRLYTDSTLALDGDRPAS